MASSHRSLSNHLGREHFSSTSHYPAGGLMNCTYANSGIDFEKHFVGFCVS